jgi:hypothetical protein
MGSPPAEPQRPPGEDPRIEKGVPASDQPVSAQVESASEEVPDSPPRADAGASERTVRYLMGPTAFCA